MSQKVLLTINDGTQNKTCDLDSVGKETVVIGRSRDCDIMLQSPKVSGHHGLFYRQSGSWYYQDLGSTNGSIANGQRITTTALGSGMNITLGPGGDAMSANIGVQMQTVSNPVVNVGIQQPVYDPYGGQEGGYTAGGQSPIGGYPNGGQGSMGGYPGGQDSVGGYPGGGYSGGGGGIYRPSPNSSAFVWMIISGVLWSVIGVILFIDFVRGFEVVAHLGELMESEFGWILLIFLLSYTLLTIGSIVLPITLFIHNKKGASIGADLVAAGTDGTYLSMLILIFAATGRFAGYLFQSTYFVLFLLALVFIMVGVSILASNFKRNSKGIKLGGRWYAPIICIVIAVILIIVILTALESNLNSVLDSDISLFGALPNSKIWIAFIWISAIITSSAYLHNDEM